MTKPTPIKPTHIFVATDTVEGGVSVFSLEQVTSMDVRGNGALVIQSGNRIVQAFNAGNWNTAFLGSPQPQAAPEKPGDVIQMPESK